LLGQTGFGTVEPKNIEAVLGTQFTSMRHFLACICIEYSNMKANCFLL
jgi:hypothetical protein